MSENNEKPLPRFEQGGAQEGSLAFGSEAHIDVLYTQVDALYSKIHKLQELEDTRKSEDLVGKYFVINYSGFLDYTHVKGAGKDIHEVLIDYFTVRPRSPTNFVCDYATYLNKTARVHQFNSDGCDKIVKEITKEAFEDVFNLTILKQRTVILGEN